MSVLFRGCLCMMIIATLFLLTLFGGCTALTDNLVEWKAAGIPLEVAKVEATREAHTVDVNAEVAVTVAKLNAETAVTLAEINADTTKKTDGSFIIFWLIRAGGWTLSGLGILYVALRFLLPSPKKIA